MHKAKAVAARQGRPLRDLVSEALERAVVENERAERVDPSAGSEWKAFLGKLEKQPDGSYFNPEGIQDERFFEVLEGLREERMTQPMRNPFDGFGFDEAAPAPPPSPFPAPPMGSRKRPPAAK